MMMMATIPMAPPDTDKRARAASIEVMVETSFDDCASVAAEWDQLVLKVGGDIYMTYDWCRIWWKHYGTDRQLAIYLIRDQDHSLIGVLPVCIERAWLGPVSLRVGKLVGSDSSLTLCQPIVEDTRAVDAFTHVLRDLLSRRCCDAVSLGPLSDRYEALPTLRSACVRLCDVGFIARDIPEGVHVRFTLPPTFDAYLTSIGKRQRGNYRRQLRQLEKGRLLRNEVFSVPERLIPAFRAMRTLHAAQWRAVGKQGHFGDWPDSIAFNEELLTCLGQLGRARCQHITVDGQLICAQYCYVFGQTNYWRLPARAVGRSWDSLGVGTIGLVKQIEQAIGEGLGVVEAGIGSYDYKIQFGGESVPLRALLVVAQRRGSRLRAKWFVWAAELLDLLYYRLWFKRIAPRLSLRRAPLWRCWIRSRI